MKSAEKQFPILKGGDKYNGVPDIIPWRLLSPFEATAQRNHGGQSLTRLSERGGLSPDEIMAVLNGTEYRKYWEGKSREQIFSESCAQLKEILKQDAIQSSDNYQKGYLDCGNKLCSIANQVEYPTKEMEEHLESKRKEFGL